jgi:fibronectin-binding autotransporter adhesin
MERTQGVVGKALRKVLAVFVVLMVGIGLTYGQGNLILRDGVSYSGAGTINVKKDIDNSHTSSAVSLGGTVNLTGTSALQNVGNATKPAITFATLQAQGSQPKQLNVTVTVSEALNVDNAITVDVTDQTLNIGKAATLTGTLDVDNGGSTVNFTRNDGTAQTVLGLTYAGTLGMSGSSAKSLGGATSAATVTHAGGDLTVDNTLSVSGSGTFATVADITGSLTFGASATVPSFTGITAINGGSLTSNSTNAITIGSLGGNTGSVTAAGSGGLTVTSATNGSGTIEAQAGSVTIASLGGNSGTIQTTGAGGLSFTGAAANGGTIQGTAASSGAIAFGNTLSQTGGAVTAGPGGASFGNTVTNDGTSSITAGTGAFAAALDFNGNVDNSGTITLGSNGSATFAGSFVTSGTLALNAASNWTYDGAAQSIAGGGSVTYGNLFTAGSATKTALGDIAVAGNFDNGSGITTDMDTYDLNVIGTRDNTGGTLRFGGLTNGLSFASTAASAGTVVYDGATGSVASQQIAAGSYYILQFEGDAPKNVLTNTTISTGSDVALAANVTLNINQTSGTTIFNIGASGTGSGNLTLASLSALLNQGTLNIGGDLDVAGALTNDGTVTVGY